VVTGTDIDDADGEVVPADQPLTTKERGHRFVERQPAVPDQHDVATVELLSRIQRVAYGEARREYHADLPLANTPTIQKVISTARLLVQLNRQQISARRGLIVSGASGRGRRPR
jgi:hypothetical protein